MIHLTELLPVSAFRYPFPGNTPVLVGVVVEVKVMVGAMFYFLGGCMAPQVAQADLVPSIATKV